MDTTRFILVVALSLVGVLLWDAWQRDYGPQQPPLSSSETTAETSADVPAYTTTTPADDRPLAIRETNEADELLQVETDILRLRISRRGGTIISTELLQFPVSLDEPATKVQLLQNDPVAPYIVQGGLLGKEAAPTHDVMFDASERDYVLQDGQDILQVSLIWRDEQGVTVRKIYEFRRGSYLVQIRYEIDNNSTETWNGRAYGQIQRTAPENGMNMVYTYTGGVISSPEERYKKISFDDMREEKLAIDVNDGWAAMIQHYFLSALLPADSAPHHYYTLFVDKSRLGSAMDRFVIGTTTPGISVDPGSTGKLEHRLYLGPKIQGQLEKIAPGLELTVDYGIFWFIAKPLFWCLEMFHKYTGNWGWSIILVTLMLKVLFYKLSAAGYRSMANMRRVQPRLLAVRDRYKNDRARLNQAMMDLYKQEKINPLGGCFPILIQIPVFIALYWVLLESVELRQAGFVLWIKDLSTPDPFFVLPLIMGVTMFVQQKLNPAPLDPVQEKVMQILPVVFTVFFAFFPSGLVLYWVVNNILSIAQQWLITRNLERAGLKA